MRRAGMVLLGIVAALGQPATAATLHFVREGAQVREVDVPALMKSCRVETIAVDDPNYGARKRYRACDLGEVLRFGFGTAPGPGTDVFFRSWDGYDKPTSAEQLGETGGWLAFGEADLSADGTLRFAPLGERKVDPGPLYVVWTKPSQRDASAYPWPYQLAEIEVSEFRKKYPHVVPTGVPRTSPVWQGFELFRGECVACHAINREGGDVGPDLNVPQSIVEYRPEAQIKAYIKNPASFRYGKMPAHEDLTDADLDGLIAYFRAMKDRKHDPAAAKP